MIWAELTARQRAAETRALVETRGLTYTEAARELGTTRNSIAGLAQRRGIHSPNPPDGSGTLKAERPPARETPSSPFTGPAWLPLPGSTPVRLEDHHETQCRWPVGPRLFCGTPVRPGEHQRYCQAHHDIGVKVLPPKPERKPK